MDRAYASRSRPPPTRRRPDAARERRRRAWHPWWRRRPRRGCAGPAPKRARNRAPEVRDRAHEPGVRLPSGPARNRGRADRSPAPCTRGRSRREERAVIDTVHAHATRTGRRPGDDVDREPLRKRAHRRRAQPRDRCRARCGTSPRATSSRATPSYANGATHQSMPGGGGASRRASHRLGARRAARLATRAARARAGEHHREEVVDQPTEGHARTLRAAYDSFLRTDTGDWPARRTWLGRERL